MQKEDLKDRLQHALDTLRALDNVQSEDAEASKEASDEPGKKVSSIYQDHLPALLDVFNPDWKKVEHKHAVLVLIQEAGEKACPNIVLKQLMGLRSLPTTFSDSSDAFIKTACKPQHFRDFMLSGFNTQPDDQPPQELIALMERWKTLEDSVIEKDPRYLAYRVAYDAALLQMYIKFNKVFDLVRSLKTEIGGL
jgi:hypothetical protein